MTEPTGDAVAEDPTLEAPEATEPETPAAPAEEPAATPEETPEPVTVEPDLPVDEHKAPEDTEPEAGPEVVAPSTTAPDLPAANQPSFTTGSAEDTGLSNKEAAAKRVSEAVAAVTAETGDPISAAILHTVPTPITVLDGQGVERLVGSPSDDGWVHPSSEADPKEIARIAAVNAALEAKKEQRLAQLDDRG